jgi:hypothetical protein
MKTNVGTIDKVIRLSIALVFIVLFFTHLVEGILGYVLLALAGVFTVTSFISFCPIYWPFGISTAKKTK